MKILLIIPFVLYISCSTRNDYHIIDIDITKKSTLDDIIYRTEIIPLETTDSSLIRNITKVVFYEEKYFVKDIYEGLFVFDKNGKFLYQIGKKGRGPGEYGYISDFNINKSDSNVELLTPFGKIQIFNKNGTYINSLENPVSEASHFLDINEDLILFYHQSLNTVLTLFSRTENKVVKNLIVTPENFERRRPLFIDTPPFYISGNEIIIHYSYSNDIYRLKGKELEYKFSLDFGKRNFNINDFKWSLDLDKSYYIDQIWHEQDLVFGFHNYFENDRYFLTSFYNKSGSKMLIMDKKIHEYKVISVNDKAYEMFRNRITWRELSPAEESGTRLKTILNWDSGENYILTSVKPEMKAFYINPRTLDDENRRKYESITLNNNPFLVKYYLKNN